MGNTLNRPNTLFKTSNKESYLTHKRNESTKISSSQFWEKIKSNIVLKPKKPKDNTIENIQNKLLKISNECNHDEIYLKPSDTCPNSSKNNINEISDEEEEIEETDEEE